ncbi:DUF2599 domain-containing protein [Bacillus sp. FJAT-22090]|uniref:DUF2599 domain-containing protein n=1 Tax=Bacillus sp. FJAT-22090 TaxID=1581038 RepID=UPI0011A81A5B|nr:DUF2599 domain-containing protein [Bacillus sp. FJAT-22090]
MRKIITGLMVLSIVYSFGHITSVKALEKTTYLITEENKKIAIGLPTMISNVKTEALKETSYSKVMDGNSEVLNITLVPSTLGTKIQVPLELNKGETAVFYKNEFGRTFNSGNIYNKYNHSIGVIDVKVANNDGNTQIITSIDSNNILLLNVKTKNVSNLIDIQVNMKATSFSTYFTKSEWIYRGGITSLSLSQKPDVASSKNSDLNKVIKIDAWDKIKSIHTNNSKWYNSEGMQNQFDCHFDFAKKKDLWNLEPDRPNVDYFSTVLASCNP